MRPQLYTHNIILCAVITIENRSGAVQQQQQLAARCGAAVGVYEMGRTRAGEHLVSFGLVLRSAFPVRNPRGPSTGPKNPPFPVRS